MSLRSKIALLLAAVIALTAGTIAALVSYSTGRAYAQMDEERSTLLANQYQQTFKQRGAEIAGVLDEIARADSTVQSLAEMSQHPQDYSLFLDSAERMSGGHLELMEVLAEDGTIISSKQWPARFGYREDWVTQDPANQSKQDSFLQPVELPAGTKLAMMALREMRVSDRRFYLAGGESLGHELPGGTGLPAGMQALLYSAAPGVSESQRMLAGQNEGIPIDQVDEIAGEVERRKAPVQATNAGHGSGTLSVRAFPLFDRTNDVAAVLIVSSSREPLQALNRRIRWTAAAVAGGGVLLGLVLSALLAGRVTRPVEELAVAADAVAAGNLDTTVDDSRQDEIGSLAYAFNRMTRELLEQREKLVQSERVAAWRELARRLAHELKNPLFPLQITVENLLRAREQAPGQFEEVFNESSQTLLAEIENLKTIVERFSDFSKMPSPELQPVNINEAVRRAVRVYEGQFCCQGRPLITAVYELDKTLEQKNVSADPELLHRALSNLVLNAMDAMPKGGKLKVRTHDLGSSVKIEIADTGTGMTEEERKRLFTPYYTSKQYGTGLGLAIVQSVVSDHAGKVWVQSEVGKGTSFFIELPKEGPQHAG